MHYVRVGRKVVNLDSVSYCEAQVWQDAMSVKIFMMGNANNTPLVLNEEEAKEFWKYMDIIAKKPL